MSIPTPWETTGVRTTWALENQFTLDLVAASSRVAVETVGTSEALGRAMRMWRIGSPTAPPSPTVGTPNNMLITAGIHGNEYMSREGALELIRDLAFTTDTVLVAYLEAHPIYVMPTCNPDRIEDPQRNTPNGTNINRNHIAQNQGESKAIWEAIRRVKPIVALDMHEYFTTRLYDMAPMRPAHPQISQSLIDLGDELYDVIFASLGAEGWLVGPYGFGASLTLPTMLNQTVALATGAFGWTAETCTEEPEVDRLAIHRSSCDTILRWHAANAVRIKGTVELARVTKMREGKEANASYRLMDSPAVLTPQPSAYRLTAVQYAAVAQQRSTFGLTVVADGDGWLVPMAQQAQPIIPLVFDKQSPYRVVTGDRVHDHGPLVPSAWGPLRVGGSLNEVVQVSRIVGGEERLVEP